MLWHGDRLDDTVKYEILNSNDDAVYKTDYNCEVDAGFVWENGFDMNADDFMAMMNYLPSLLKRYKELESKSEYLNAKQV